MEIVNGAKKILLGSWNASGPGGGLVFDRWEDAGLGLAVSKKGR